MQRHPVPNQHLDQIRVSWEDGCVSERHVEQMTRNFYCGDDVDYLAKILSQFRDLSQRKYVDVLILQSSVKIKLN